MPNDIKDVSDKMRGLDLCTLVTFRDGVMAGRPMSNNGEVDYDGDSYFFTYDHAGMVRDIRADDHVALTFQKGGGLIAGAPLFLHVQGRAALVRDKSAFEAHWSPDLDRWFPDGIDTPGMIMIAVKAERIAWWQGEDERQLVV